MYLYITFIGEKPYLLQKISFYYVKIPFENATPFNIFPT